MHRIVTDDPDYRRHVSKPAEQLARAKQASLARARETQERYDRDLQAYEAARRTALLAGRPSPEPPAKPHREHDEHVFVHEAQRRRDAERRWLADNADRIETAVAEREAALLARARELIAQLDTLTPELTQLAGTLRDVRRVAGDRRPVPGALDVAALVQAITADAAPSTPRPTSRRSDVLRRVQTIP